MTMTRFLKYFDLDINDFYSREDFEKDYERTLGYGLVYSLIFLPFMFASEDDVPDLTKDDIANLTITVDERYKSRIQGIVDDYIEWGII